MKQIPQDILSRFVRLLQKNNVPVDQHAEYKKWLRFYIDFCNKYYFPPTDNNSLPHFLQKLKDKRQSDIHSKKAISPVDLEII